MFVCNVCWGATPPVSSQRCIGLMSLNGCVIELLIMNVCMDVVLVCVSISPMYTPCMKLYVLPCHELVTCPSLIPGPAPFSPEAYNILWKNKRVQVRKKRSSPIRLTLTLYNPRLFNPWQCFDKITGPSSLLHCWFHVDVRIHWIHWFYESKWNKLRQAFGNYSVILFQFVFNVF